MVAVSDTPTNCWTYLPVKQPEIKNKQENKHINKNVRSVYQEGGKKKHLYTNKQTYRQTICEVDIHWIDGLTDDGQQKTIIQRKFDQKVTYTFFFCKFM